MTTPFSGARGRSLAAAVFLWALTLSSAGAVPKGYLVNADKVTYDHKTGTIEAVGHVEAFYKNIRMQAERARANTQSGDFDLKGKVTLTLEEYSLTGDRVFYNVKNRTGDASNVTIHVGSMRADAVSMILFPKRVEMIKSSVTSCEQAVPHYRMTADSMSFYTKNGWVVFQNGFLKIKEVPVFWIPTYVYDLGSVEDRRNRHPAPLPEFEGNNIDGFGVEEKILYRLTDYSYGMVRAKYAANQGFGLGVETNYFVDDNNEGHIRLMTWGQQGTFGGVTHIVSFGDILEEAKERRLVYEVFQTPARRNYELFTEVSLRERINFERVTLFPSVMLRTTRVPIGTPYLSWSGEVSIANIMEESMNLQRVRARGILAGNATLYKDSITNVDTGVVFNLAAYDWQNQWSQVVGFLEAKKFVLPNLDLKTRYEHYFVLNGISPFRFENYQYFAQDGIDFRADARLGTSRIGGRIQYNLPSGLRRELDMELAFGFDCFEVSGTWQMERGTFALGVNLVNK